MTNECQYLNKYGSWSWDQESRTRANGLLSTMSKFEFTITMITVMKCLSVVKQLSIQLQKRASDIYRAYSQVSSVKEDLQAPRRDIDVLFVKWYESSVDLGKDFDIVPSMPRIARIQQHRQNTPSSSPCEYYKRSQGIPLVDHLSTEMDKFFSADQMNVSKLISLVPEVLVATNGCDLEEAVKFYTDDLESPDLLDVELVRWRSKWTRVEEESIPRSAVDALKNCDAEFYPNVHVLLQILCTLPVTSAESERSFSTMKRLKTYLRNTMSTERESSLALMSVLYNRSLDVDAIIDTFATRHSRRLLFADILSGDK
ncbi:52 kDa repressor of the inhibitor of the protein kinase-like [Nematostella vectensis]|uniref:52 kDa repressor of the inhibitor of the protein kinase-like n=1 Tax=Nematostella vectensis TaxID=45351 RepID=UPI0020775077|nr:52 kDa repressor of the inhibitor of the protein kinase-like [Nematostella vectensis]